MDIVERLREKPELTPAQYWEAQASMWHENYKEAANDVERLRSQMDLFDPSTTKEMAAAALNFANDEIKRLRKVGKILAEEIVELTEELIKLRAKDKGPIDYIIDSHGMTHASFTIVYKPEVQAQ